jgi:hypothetical protein
MDDTDGRSRQPKEGHMNADLLIELLVLIVRILAAGSIA